ncbi:MAG TPA: C39 family peptidase [Anaerolineae bacterium]|nr:C39 family peptidase [Anaerolineae bacterium]
MTEALSVPLVGQRDERWRNVLLGNSGETIGNYGCAIACLAMLGAHAQREPVQPLDVLNNMLRSVGGFYNRNLLRWGITHTIYSNLRYVGRIDIGVNRPATVQEMRTIYDALSRAAPIIIYVDSREKEPGLQQHFVLVVGADAAEQSLVIHDPWFGDATCLCPRYGPTPQEAVCGVIIYDVLDTPPPRTFPELRTRRVEC